MTDISDYHMTSPDGDEDSICTGLDGLYSPGIHIVALFVVLVASLVGALLPLLGKRVPALHISDYVYAVGKCLGTGVMLAVGLIHMMGEAAENFGASCVPEAFQEAYESWAFLLAGIAIVLMHAIDIVIGEIVHSWYAKKEQQQQEQLGSQDCGHEKCGRDQCLESSIPSSNTEPLSSPADNGSAPENQDVVVGEVPCADHGCEGHQHGVVVPKTMSSAQRVVAAVCMEFGVTLHSVLVGLDLGVTANDEVKVLMVALLFHQLFEGIAMGSRLADAEFKLSLEVVLMLVFTFSAPVGVAIGTAAVSSSPTALSGAKYVMVSSILDSLCGGILVYLALSLMLLDFPKDMRRLCPSGSPRCVLKKIGMFLGVWVGAGVMMLIGKWC